MGRVGRVESGWGGKWSAIADGKRQGLVGGKGGYGRGGMAGLSRGEPPMVDFEYLAEAASAASPLSAGRSGGFAAQRGSPLADSSSAVPPPPRSTPSTSTLRALYGFFAALVLGSICPAPRPPSTAWPPLRRRLSPLWG